MIDDIAPILTILFNDCLQKQKIPDEWKSAVVTVLFKNKGSINDINNYRGISVLPPISKIFEKILSHQIFIYFNSNNLFYDGQYGFRQNHSCEAALHKIISEINSIRNTRHIGLLLFLYFRKAFGLVDSSLLLKKKDFMGLGKALSDYLKIIFYIENKLSNLMGIIQMIALLISVFHKVVVLDQFYFLYLSTILLSF